MFQFGLGMQERLLLLVVVALIFCRGACRHWMGVLAATMALGVAVTPADPISTLLVAAPLSITFALGVHAAPFFQSTSTK